MKGISKKTYILDTSAMLAYIEDEEGAGGEGWTGSNKKKRSYLSYKGGADQSTVLNPTAYGVCKRCNFIFDECEGTSH